MHIISKIVVVESEARMQIFFFIGLSCSERVFISAPSLGQRRRWQTPRSREQCAVTLINDGNTDVVVVVVVVMSVLIHEVLLQTAI